MSVEASCSREQIVTQADALESRILMAATDYAFLTGTQLTIRGGDATSADVITLAKSGTTSSSTNEVNT